MFLKILLRSLPGYLLQKLRSFYEKERHRKRLHPTNLATRGAGLRTYDLINSGPNSRFVLGNGLVVHNCSYGAGPAKIHEALTLSGVDITLDECRTIHAGYWELCGGIKRWERELKRQWTDNKGWLFNGIGRPICVDPDYMKDLVNRVVQSTGHDAFILFLMQTMELRKQGFEFYPWSADVHDAWYMEVREDQAEAFCQAVLNEVIPAWNDLLGGEIRLKAEPAIVSNLALDKLEGAELEKAKEYAGSQKDRLRQVYETSQEAGETPK